MPREPQRRSNLSHHVAEELGRAIVSGRIPATEPFPTEAELAVSFKVSRTAVREAVKMLSAKGLIASKPRQGIRVLPEEAWNILDTDLLQWSLDSSLTHAVLTEFFQMRAAIEPEAAALAARFATPGQLRAIGDALQTMQSTADDTDRARDADVAFHVAILYATGNRFYVRMRDFIRTALDVSIRLTGPPGSGHAAALHKHAAVFAAIERGRSEQARRAMRDLVDEAFCVFEDTGTRKD